MTVGVLALQGDFVEHLSILESMGIQTLEVRTPEDLSKVHRLIIPGGESTAISLLLESSGLKRAIVERVKAGTLPILGTCAGVILLAKHVTGKNAPSTLRLMDITVDRNAYGSQLQSFDEKIRIKGSSKPLNVSFIRAPRITATGKHVQVLATYGSSAVFVRQGSLFAATFHAEVKGISAVHALFLDA